MRIIVSTASMLKYLQKLNVPLKSYDDNYYDLQIKDKVLTISTDTLYIKSIDVQAKENIDCSVSATSILKLINVLKCLSDSPICIEIKDTSSGFVIREAFL